MAAIPPFDERRPLRAGVSSTPRSLSDRFAEVKNVLDYGVVGDGATDDTAAFQAAIDAAGHGGTVVIPPGLRILIYDQITIPYRGLRLIGPGFEYNIHDNNDGADDDTKNMVRCMFDDPDRWLLFVTGTYVQIDGVILDMNRMRTGGIGMYGYVDPWDPARSVNRPGSVRSCLVDRCGGHGIFLGNPATDGGGGNVHIIADTYIGGDRYKGGKGFDEPGPADGSIGLRIGSDCCVTNIEVKSDFHYGCVINGSSPFMTGSRFDICHIGMKIEKTKYARIANTTCSYNYLYQLQVGPDPDEMPGPDGYGNLVEASIVSSTFYQPMENKRTTAGLDSAMLHCQGNDKVKILVRFANCLLGHANTLSPSLFTPESPGYPGYHGILAQGNCHRLMFNGCKIGFTLGPYVTFEDAPYHPAHGKIVFFDSMFNYEYWRQRVWRHGGELVDFRDQLVI